MGARQSATRGNGTRTLPNLSRAPQPTHLSSRRILVTGASSGIGFETSCILANRGAHVLMLCRNDNTAHAAQKRLMEHTAPRYPVECVTADYTCLQQVSDAADYIRDRYPSHIDGVVHCAGTAGVLAPKPGAVDTLTSDGLNYVLQVNHVAPYLLTQRLLPTLKATARSNLEDVWDELQTLSEDIREIEDNHDNKEEKGLKEKICERTVRIIHVSDLIAETKARITMNGLEMAEMNASDVGPSMYMNTKWMNIMTTEILAHENPLKYGVLSHSVALPPTSTSLYRDIPSLFRSARALVSRSAAASAQDVVGLLSAYEYGASNGKQIGITDLQLNKMMLAKLKNQTERILTEIDPKFLNIQ